MLGDLLSTIGLVLSGHGFISSLRTDSALTDIKARLSEAERKLSDLRADATYIRTSTEILRNLDAVLRTAQIAVKLDPRYTSPPDLVAEFSRNPGAFGAPEFQSWQNFLNQLQVDLRETHGRYFAKNIPIIVVRNGGELAVTALSRERLEVEDLFQASPIATFDPNTVKSLAQFISKMEISREAGDFFEVQFEEEV